MHSLPMFSCCLHYGMARIRNPSPIFAYGLIFHLTCTAGPGPSRPDSCHETMGCSGITYDLFLTMHLLCMLQKRPRGSTRVSGRASHAPGSAVPRERGGCCVLHSPGGAVTLLS